MFVSWPTHLSVRHSYYFAVVMNRDRYNRYGNYSGFFGALVVNLHPNLMSFSQASLKIKLFLFGSSLV